MNLALPGLAAPRPDTDKPMMREPLREARSRDDDFSAAFAQSERNSQKDVGAQAPNVSPEAKDKRPTEQTGRASISETTETAPVGGNDKSRESNEPDHESVEIGTTNGEDTVFDIMIFPFAAPVEPPVLMPKSPGQEIVLWPVEKSNGEVAGDSDVISSPGLSSPQQKQGNFVLVEAVVPSVSKETEVSNTEGTPQENVQAKPHNSQELTTLLKSVEVALESVPKKIRVPVQAGNKPEVAASFLQAAGIEMPRASTGAEEQPSALSHSTQPETQGPKVALNAAPKTSVQAAPLAQAPQTIKPDMWDSGSPEVAETNVPAPSLPREGADQSDAAFATFAAPAVAIERIATAVEVAQPDVAATDVGNIVNPRSERTSTLVPDVALLARPETARHVAAQIADVIRAGSDGTLEITLRPEELGRLSLSFSRDGAAMQVTLTAERPETLDLVRRNIEVLEQDLKDLGYQSFTFNFGNSGGDQKQPERRGGGGRSITQDPQNAAEAMVATQPTGRTATGGIDLRL